MALFLGTSVPFGTTMAGGRQAHGARPPSRRVVRRWLEGPEGIAVRAALATVPLVAMKWGANAAGIEFIDTLSIATALLGGVTFTLAIMVSGVFADFKECERLVSEVASTFRRLHADLALIAGGKDLEAMRAELAVASASLRADLRSGDAVRMRRIHAPLRRLDDLVADASRSGAPSSNVRTVQVGVGTLVRALDRMESIMETRFLRAGFVFATCAVAGALGTLTLARVGPLAQGLALHAFASFLLCGLLLLIRDLDNPFSGSVRASTAQIEKVDAWLQSAS